MIITYVRTIILYTVLVAVVRMMGKRQIGEMEPSEFVVTMLLADLAAVPMQDTGIPLLAGVIPIVTVLALELILAALSMRSIRARKLLCGTPVILMENGKILQQNLKKTRLTLDELTELLRNAGHVDLNTIQYAILETNGRLSILPYPKYAPPTAKDMTVHATERELPFTVIADGRLLRHNLHLVGRDEAWLDQTLKKLGCDAEQVYLLTVTPSGTLYFARREEE
jgi:uncharacterized membrane protein YcaP (DUF421 family)